MAIGQTIRATSGATPADTVYYSPWFPSAGNKAVFTCDVIATSSLASFKITVQTKNSEDSDKAQNTVVPNGGTDQTITLSTNTQTRWEVGADIGNTANNGFLELVRFKYAIKSSANSYGWVHFRMLDPQWLTN